MQKSKISESNMMEVLSEDKTGSVVNLAESPLGHLAEVVSGGLCKGSSCPSMNEVVIAARTNSFSSSSRRGRRRKVVSSSGCLS